MAVKSLFDLVTGDRGVIRKIEGLQSPELRQRLLDMGITRDAPVEVVRHAPLGDPVEVRVKGTFLALRMEEARYIQVETPDP